MSEKLPEHVFHQFDNLFDKMDGAHFGEAEIAGILHGAKNDGIYPGADYVYRYIQCLQIRLREEKERTLHQKYKRSLDNAEICCEKKENCYNRALRKYSKDEADYLVRKSNFWQDWEFRWLKIAEKIKEIKL